MTDAPKLRNVKRANKQGHSSVVKRGIGVGVSHRPRSMYQVLTKDGPTPCVGQQLESWVDYADPPPLTPDEDQALAGANIGRPQGRQRTEPPHKTSILGFHWSDPAWLIRSTVSS